jgi:Transposase DDE domain
MAPDAGFASPLRFLTDNPVVVLERLRQGDIDSMDWAADQVTDFHLLYALESGLLDRCAQAFPDPRGTPEIPIRVLLAAAVAGAFQGEYALCQLGVALHSPAVLAQLGVNVQWLTPGEGLSRRGTQEEAVFHPDTLRKLLRQIADRDREAGRRPGESLLSWWNETVGPTFLRQAGGGSGAWILDCTKLLVNWYNPRYEGSDTSKEEDGQPIRGYKLALLSALIDTGRVIPRIGWDTVRAADITVARPLVGSDPPLSAGESLRHDRGLIDGEVISCLKRDLGVDTIFALKAEMLSYRLALAQVTPWGRRWEKHPTRTRQEICLVEGIGGPWEECTVPLNGCVVREKEETEPDGYRYWVFATTDLSRSARGIIRDYEARPECEEDHRQLKGDDWEMDEFCSTSLVEIVFHVLMVLFAYNLCQVYGQTEKGERFAGKTKRARQRQVRRERVLRVLVIAAPYYAVLEHLDVSEVLLEAEGAPRERLRAVVKRLKADRARHR